MYQLLIKVPRQSSNKYIFSAKSRPGRTKMNPNTSRRNANESLSAPEDFKISKKTCKLQNFIFIKRASPERRRKKIIKKSF